MFCHCFDENIYIFELFGLTLICKELALLACRLTIVYPALTHTTRTSFQCVRHPRKRSPLVFLLWVMNYDPAVWVDISVWFTEGSWMLVLAGQESEYDTEPGPLAKSMKWLIWSLFYLQLCFATYTRQCVIFFLFVFDNIVFNFYPYSRCGRGEYTVSTFRLLLWEDVCSCAKCVNAIRSYTLWSSQPFLWLGSSWVKLWERLRLLWCILTPNTPIVYTVIDEPRRNLLYWVIQQIVECSLVADSDLQGVAGENEQELWVNVATCIFICLQYTAL